MVPFKTVVRQFMVLVLGLAQSVGLPAARCLLSLYRLTKNSLLATLRGCLYASGLKASQFTTLPQVSSTSGLMGFKPVNQLARLMAYVLRIAKVLFYPEIIFRNLFFGVVLQLGYVGGRSVASDIEYHIQGFTASGRAIRQERELLKRAKTYREYRDAEKALDKAIVASGRAMTPEETAVCAKLKIRVDRYTNLIRENDLRSLQFELRSDLLRKHFGHTQTHPDVRVSILSYASVVIGAFHLLATGRVPVRAHS